MRRSIAGMALGLTLAMPPLAGRAIAAGPYDAVYAGPMRETLNNNSGFCQNLNHDTRVSVVNGVISFPWGRVTLQATVGADGSFFSEVPGMQATRGTSATYQLKGRIAGGTLEADVGGTACAAHLSLRKM
jgi:hypothetical protein